MSNPSFKTWFEVYHVGTHVRTDGMTAWVRVSFTAPPKSQTDECLLYLETLGSEVLPRLNKAKPLSSRDVERFFEAVFDWAVQTGLFKWDPLSRLLRFNASDPGMEGVLDSVGCTTQPGGSIWFQNWLKGPSLSDDKTDPGVGPPAFSPTPQIELPLPKPVKRMARCYVCGYDPQVQGRRLPCPDGCVFPEVVNG